MPYVVALLHPAALLRGRWNEEPAQITYLRRWSRVAKGLDPWTPEDINQPPPNSTLFPRLEQLHQFSGELLEFTEPCLSIDTEEAGIYLICVGLTQLDLANSTVGNSLNLPIRLRGGRQAWSPQQLPQVVEWLDSLLANPVIAKVLHNGVTHDIPILEELGFTVKGELFDTMVMAHLAYPEFRKGLQFTSTLYLGASHWKHLVSEDDELEEKG